KNAPAPAARDSTRQPDSDRSPERRRDANYAPTQQSCFGQSDDQGAPRGLEAFPPYGGPADSMYSHGNGTSRGSILRRSGPTWRSVPQRRSHPLPPDRPDEGNHRSGAADL